MTSPPCGASAPTQTRTACPDHSGDLVVVIHPERGIAEYLGSRALLEAEGLVPAGTDWPAAWSDQRWQSGGFSYWLRRRRPPGAKGRRSAHAEADWFALRWEPVNAPRLDNARSSARPASWKP